LAASAFVAVRISATAFGRNRGPECQDPRQPAGPAGVL